MDPLSFLRYLGSIGRIVHLETIADAMPEAADMDPETCYLGFEISFASSADKAAIERVFDFVRDDCTLNILPPHSRLSDYIALINTLPEDSMRLGEILVRIGAPRKRTGKSLRQRTPCLSAAESPGAPAVTSCPSARSSSSWVVQAELVDGRAQRSR